MRELLMGTWQVVLPVLETTPLKQWWKFIDANFLFLTASATLFASLVLWANI